MTVELIAGFSGTPHINSSDVGAYNAGLVGPGDYALATGDQLKATMSSATTFILQSGDAVLNGRHVHLTGGTAASVSAGVAGQKRNDIAALRYTRDTTTNIETVQLVIIKGTATTGTPADPTYNKGLITDGVSTHDMPLYRIPLNGITPGALVPLFNVLKPMADVWDSLTPTEPATLINSQYGTVKGCRTGHVATIRFDWKSASTESWGVGNMGVLPVGFRPPIDLTFSYGGRDNMSQRAINIKTDGTMTYSNMGGQQGSSPFGATYTYIV